MASNHDQSMSFPFEIFEHIIDEGAELYSGEERRAFLRVMSVVCKNMTLRAQSHLFGNTITFRGNGGLGEKGRGFNNWCQVLAALKKTKTAENNLPDIVLVGVIKTIKYIRPGFDMRNRILLPTKQREYLDVFTKVTRLEMSGFESVTDPNWTPVFGKSLGKRIRYLDLTKGKMNVNEFVKFLYVFTELRHLRISDPRIESAEVAVRNPSSLPKGTFSGVLYLHFSGPDTSRKILQMLCSIPFEMNYSQIVLDDKGVSLAESNLSLSQFLSKCKTTLEYLRFHSSWGPFDLTGMDELRKVVINSRDLADFGNIIMNTLNPLPLNKIALVLIIDSEFLDPGRNQDHLLEWKVLDNRLKLFFGSHWIPGRSQENPLHFYVIGDNRYHNEKWTELIPDFMERTEVEVDPSLIKEDFL